VELIGDGKRDSGLPWCGTPTHMLSYLWSYSIATIVAGLRTFERDENLPSKNECYYYYFIVRVTCALVLGLLFHIHTTSFSFTFVGPVCIQPACLCEGLHAAADGRHDALHAQGEYPDPRADDTPFAFCTRVAGEW
jgi:hypothetical protein